MLSKKGRAKVILREQRSIATRVTSTCARQREMASDRWVRWNRCRRGETRRNRNGRGDGRWRRAGNYARARVFAITRMLQRAEIGDLSLLARLSVPRGRRGEHVRRSGKIDGESLAFNCRTKRLEQKKVPEAGVLLAILVFVRRVTWSVAISSLFLHFLNNIRRRFFVL